MPGGDILSTLTVSGSKEGAPTQQVVILRSSDAGSTWTQTGEMEPVDAPEASWGMPWLSPKTGALYVFYLFNFEDVRQIPGEDGAITNYTLDSIGRLCFRVSTDGGLTFGERHVLADQPPTDIDYRNAFGGAKRMFWCSGHPVDQGNHMLMGMTKVGSTAELPGRDTEAFLLRIEEDAIGVLRAGQRPAGTIGIRIGDANEEPSILAFDDGAINVVFRTNDGYLGEAWSTDDGMSFEVDWARDQSGERIQQPRAKAYQTHLPAGRLFLWHHDAKPDPLNTFLPRNPVHYRTGRRDGPRVRWSAPAILLRDSINPEARISYPSLVARGDTVFIAATDKSEARVFTLRPESLT